jgi:acyl dehydratase
MLYAEDLIEGQVFQLGTYTITEAEILQFAHQYDPVPIHTDPVAAAAGPFSGLIASGFNTIAIYQRLVVEAVWTKVAGIVGRSLEVRLPNPVRPGATLTGKSQIQNITLRPERHNAVVIFRTELVDGDGRSVLVWFLTRSFTLARNDCTVPMTDPQSRRTMS